jgi:putative chitinase
MISQAQLRELYPRATPELISEMSVQVGQLLDEFGISAKPLRTQFFLAQVGHESGGGTVKEENMNYRAARICEVWPQRFPTLGSATPFAHQPEKLANRCYSNRMGNGPPESGDGWRYRGRGLIQVTGRDGYDNVGRRAGLDLIAHPEPVFDPKHALRVACAFWKWKDLNTVSDTGDFVKVTRRINGGTVGLADRRAWLDKVRRVLAPAPGDAKRKSAQTIRDVQLELRRRGFSSVGAADGLLGPRTMAAIAEFRRQNGMAAGGLDDALIKALLPD